MCGSFQADLDMELFSKALIFHCKQDVNQNCQVVASCARPILTTTLGAPVIHVEEATLRDHGNAQVFLIWRAPASGYESATDTFIFNGQGKIIRQNVVVHYSPPSVQESWDNHFAAFGGQDVDRILLDYTEDSEIIVYDQTSGGKTVFTGLAGVRDCFTGLFARLSDTSGLTVPVVEVNEPANGQPGSVFLVWRCPASGYAEATDTTAVARFSDRTCRGGHPS